MGTALERDATATTFADVQDLIYHTLHRFKARHGGEWDDLLSDAHELFFIAYNRHDGRSSFQTYVVWVIWKGLLEYVRRNAKHYSRCDCADALDEHVMRRTSEFSIPEFAADLSRDAKLVLCLTLDQPFLQSAVPGTPKISPGRFRTALRKYLLSKGWTGSRVTAAFDEMTEALYA